MIPAETVAQVWQRMAQTPLQQAQMVIAQLQEEQPLLLDYLYYTDDLPFNRHEQEILFYIGMVLWQMMKESELPLGPVTSEMLDQAEEVNYGFVEDIGKDTAADFYSAIRTMMETHPEPHVFRYLVEAIIEKEESTDPDDPPIRKKYAGMAFLHLKIVLDALIASRTEHGARHGLHG